MAPDVDEERGVIHGGPSLLVQPHPLGEPQRDEALPEHVLHGLTEAQIDAERQGGHQLGEPNLRRVSVNRHALESLRHRTALVTGKPAGFVRT